MPAEGDSIAGATTFRANATDNVRVARVEFFADAQRVGIDSVPVGPIFEVTWTPSGLLPGTSHALRCVAIDEADNRTTSATVNVIISSAAGTHHSGVMTADETWTALGSPHVVDADLSIQATLTVEPGVVVVVADNATITVGVRANAGLVALGRLDTTIRFTSLSLSPGPGSWGGIRFEDNAGEGLSVLRHCVVEYAGSSGALVGCDAGQVVIDSCAFHSSSGRGVAATGRGIASLSATSVSGCAGYPVSVSANLVSAIANNNTLTANNRDAIEVAGGTVTASDTWPHSGVPYCVTSTVTVADTSNPLLFIAPGCSLLFGDSAALRVGVGKPGGLRADGTYGRIVLAPIAGASAKWRGIEFWEKADPFRSLLNYCSVEGAGLGNPAAITCYSVAVSVGNTYVGGGAGDGVYCYNTGLARFENNTVTGCAGFPLHIGAQYVGTIGSGNRFTGNGTSAIRVNSGALTGNTQFRRQDVPYRITGTIAVGAPAEPVLVIDPGVRLQFDSGALTIGADAPARLQAIGVPDSIVFTGTADTAGSWRGLELQRFASSASRLERCRMLYGGEGGNGILFIDQSVPTVVSNEIAFSSNCCVFLHRSELDPDTLWAQNWLHDWAPGAESIAYEPPVLKEKPDRRARSGLDH